VMSGLLFLVILNKCFKMISNGRLRTNRIALGIVGTNYFFLSAISQIRPEALALLASSLSLYMYLLWQEDTKSVTKILLAHLFVILAAMLHWQSAFMAFGLWLAYLFTDRREISRKMEVRCCFIDYDKEIALVAECRRNGERKLIGVSRISLHPDMETGDFAIAVSDPWQGKGVGALLTDYVLEVARDRGVHNIRVNVLADNQKIIDLMRHRGFDVRFAAAGMVTASLTLSPGQGDKPG